MATLISFKYH